MPANPCYYVTVRSVNVLFQPQSTFKIAEDNNLSFVLPQISPKYGKTKWNKNLLNDYCDSNRQNKLYFHIVGNHFHSIFFTAISNNIIIFPIVKVNAIIP